MMNLDELNQRKMQAAQKIVEAVESGDHEEISKSLVNLEDSIVQQVMAQVEEKESKINETALQARGKSPLTTQEYQYFEKVCEALRTDNPVQALSDIDLALPSSEIDRVLDDLKAEHPLLSAIQFTNTNALTKIFVNASGYPLGAWGTLTAAIATEISAGIEEIDLDHVKYTAYMLVDKSYLDEGPVWMENFVRTHLQECIYDGIEKAILTGDGNNAPTGMNRACGKNATKSSNAYAVKTATTVTSLDQVTYGSLLSQISKDENNRQRVIKNLILVVNPTDYYTKIMPATTYLTQNGVYVDGVLPVKTQIIQSNYVDSGKAIFGDASRYFFGVGTAGKGGKIFYSDDVKFLEDKRTYACKVYGNGTPLDNNAFLYLDISGMKAPVNKVEISGTPNVVVTNIADAKPDQTTTG